jgi:hypothetical protein
MARPSLGREETPDVSITRPSVGSSVLWNASLSSRVRFRLAGSESGMCSSTQSTQDNRAPKRGETPAVIVVAGSGPRGDGAGCRATQVIGLIPTLFDPTLQAGRS